MLRRKYLSSARASAPRAGTSARRVRSSVAPRPSTSVAPKRATRTAAKGAIRRRR